MFRISVITLAVASALCSQQLFAQEEAGGEDQDEALEEVLVTGYRGALQNSTDAKLYIPGKCASST